MPNPPPIIKFPVRPAVPAGPFWNVEQAIDAILHRNDGSRRMYKVASVFDLRDDLAPPMLAATQQQILAQENRARKVFEAFQILREMWGAGVVRSIKDGRVLPSSYGRVDPTQQVVESFTAANDGFRKLIGQIELETEHVLIPIDDMLKALRGPPAQSDSVAPTQPDGVKEIGNKPKRSKGRRLAQPPKRRPRGPDRIWTYIADVAAPQMDVIVKRDGRFQSLAAAAKRLIVLLRSARKKPPHPKTCEEHIKLEYSRWVASVERLPSTTPRRRK